MDSVGRAALEGAALGALAGGVGAAVGAAGLSGAAAFAVSEGADFIGGFLYDIGVNGLSREEALINGLMGIGFGGAIGLLGRGISRAARNVNLPLPRQLRRQCASFSAETMVATPDGDKPISEIEVGDVILAYSEATEEVDIYHVSATHTQHHETTLDVTIDGETLHTTDEHPFYVVRDNEEQWVQAKHLQADDRVLAADGTLGVVEAIEIVDQPQTMYNLTVSLVATYLVGDGQWLVHNVQIGPFDITGLTLFLGEGDFSFSRSVVEQLSYGQAQHVISSDFSTPALAPGNDMDRYLTYLDNIESLDAMGARVLPTVDAGDLLGHFPNAQFDTIIWNFPHTGGDVMSNTNLLQRFFGNVTNVLNPTGKVQVSLSSSPFYNRFGITSIANEHFDDVSFETIVPYSDYSRHFPGYEHTTTTGHAKSANIPGARVWTCKR